MVVDHFEESCIAFHLASEYGFQVFWRCVPCRYFFVPRSQFRVVRDDSELLLFCECSLTQLVPTVVELALVLGNPLLRNMVRSVSGTWGEVYEEWFVRCSRLLRAYVRDCLIRHVRN